MRGGKDYWNPLESLPPLEALERELIKLDLIIVLIKTRGDKTPPRVEGYLGG